MYSFRWVSKIVHKSMTHEFKKPKDIKCLVESLTMLPNCLRFG